MGVLPDNTLYVEKQKLKQWWLWLLLLSVDGLLVFGVISKGLYGNFFGYTSMGYAELMIIVAVLLLANLLIFTIRLDTIISNSGIYVRYQPFHFKLKKYSWDSIVKCYVRKYSPIAEYGGWGIRSDLAGKGNAMNVSGNYGLQLEFSNGKKLLIGTNKPKELEEILVSIGQFKQ